MEPYYRDDDVALYHGDMRDVLSTLHLTVDAIVADPPYGETSLTWDRWPDGWLAVAAAATSSMWCFGSMRMFLERRDEFAEWRLSQDVIWEKNAGSGFATDRFRRMHEHALHWYRGNWSAIHHGTPRVPSDRPDRGRAVLQRAQPAHVGRIGTHTWEDDGTRIQGSVIQATSMRGRAIHPTEKPVAILRPLVEYACPPGGAVLDPFAGSGSTAVAARMSGRRAVLIERHEPYCEAIARRLAQDVLPLDA